MGTFSCGGSLGMVRLWAYPSNLHMESVVSVLKIGEETEGRVAGLLYLVVAATFTCTACTVALLIFSHSWYVIFCYYSASQWL
jgi:hypothetical protein